VIRLFAALPALKLDEVEVAAAVIQIHVRSSMPCASISLRRFHDLHCHLCTSRAFARGTMAWGLFRTVSGLQQRK